MRVLWCPYRPSVGRPEEVPPEQEDEMTIWEALSRSEAEEAASMVEEAILLVEEADEALVRMSQPQGRRSFEDEDEDPEALVDRILSTL